MPVLLLTAALLAGTWVTAPPARLRVDGRFFVAGPRTLRPVFSSTLAILARTPEERRAVLDEARGLGFNGVRVFAGDLAWAKQTAASARAALPALLADAASRDLYVEVTAVTDSRGGFDVEAHLRAVSDICASSSNCLIEAANEYYHPTQSDAVQDPRRLSAIARRAIAGSLWSLGAPPFDQLQDGKWPIAAGDFITVHLDRGRPRWEQLARLRALAEIADVTNRPVISNEPIGAAEAPQRHRRESDPDFFFALGALGRLLELGSVFHSEDGLHARPLGGNQRRCAEAFVAGASSIRTEARLRRAAKGEWPVVRITGAAHVLAATDGTRWWAVLLDAKRAAITLQPGWRQSMTRRGCVAIVEIAR
jgi:hypothetical protein